MQLNQYPLNGKQWIIKWKNSSISSKNFKKLDSSIQSSVLYLNVKVVKEDKRRIVFTSEQQPPYAFNTNIGKFWQLGSTQHNSFFTIIYTCFINQFIFLFKVILTTLGYFIYACSEMIRIGLLLLSFILGFGSVLGTIALFTAIYNQQPINTLGNDFIAVCSFILLRQFVRFLADNSDIFHTSIFFFSSKLSYLTLQ
ncbi:MAG: hypothetical protein ACRCZJ_01410 [Erysipelotrichaceae bacterium]